MSQQNNQPNIATGQQQQQSVTQPHQSPQHRPSSRSNHLGLSPSASAAVAAAAAAYGPPPTSPLFMHAINGAFHYLSSSSQPPNSPGLPTTPSEKLQFNALKIDNSSLDRGEEMKPTDLSLGNSSSSSDKRPHSKSSSDDCYP